MSMDDDTCYRALTARDPRFDGLFFVGVKSTGIYCRPVCTAKTPGRSRCRFFPHAALAEQAGFRPCLRCRPELAPGFAPVDATRTVAHAAAARIEAGSLNNGIGLEELAAELGLSSRQLRRSVRKELGVSPVELAQTNRLLLAKRLIAETNLPLTRVAFAAGFESVRRFNTLFLSHYRLSPSKLRRATLQNSRADDCLRLTLAFRPPFAWEELLRFLSARAIPGVEQVNGDAYERTVGIGELRGWLRVSRVAGRKQLAVELSTALAPALPTILMRLRNLFDLDARPDVIDGHLAQDSRLAPLVKQRPGMRVPGAFDAFELSVRAVVGQQMSVRGASTLAGRIAERFGESIETPLADLNRLTPSAAVLAAAGGSSLQSIGLPSARAETLQNVAVAVAKREVDFGAALHATAVIEQLQQIPGIGPWTAEYIAMRALRWPDAFPPGDLGLKKALGLSSARAIEGLAERWRPWRAYAAMHLWESLNTNRISK